MTDIASLGIAVDSSQVSAGEKALHNLASAGSRVEAATERLVNASRKYQASLTQTRSVSEGAQQKTLSYIAALERQVALYGKSSTEALRYDANLLGMTKSQTQHVDSLLRTAQEQENLSRATEVTTNKTSMLASAVKFLVAAYGTLKVVDYIKDATLLNARYETLGVSMRIVGNNAGYSARQMEEAAVGLQKTGISMVESRQAILKLVQAQIDLSHSSKLARIAQDAAVIGNMNSSEAFARMIHGIQTGQPEVLRMLGINVSMERSYKTMADSLGVNTGQLTQAQRAQAVLNSVMKEGEGIAGTYEAAMGTAGKQLNSMTRYSENLKLMLGETFNEALVIAVEAMTVGLKGMNKEAQDLVVKGQLRQWGRDAIMIAANVIDAFRLVKNVFVQAGNGILFLYEAGKLALKGQFFEIRKLSEEQAKQNADFVKNITLVSDTAKERFAIMDRERANAAAGLDKPGKAGKSSESIIQDDAAAIKKAATEYQNLIQSIREKIAVQSLELTLGKELSSAQKTSLDAMVKLRDGELKLTDAKKMTLVAELEILSANEKSLENMQFSKTASEGLIATSQQQVMSLQEQVIAAREHNATLGMTYEQLRNLAGAKELELAGALRAAAAYAGPLHNAYLVHANDLEKLAQLQKELVDQKQITKTAEEWSRIGTTIEQTGKTAFVQFAAHGVGAMGAIGKAIKTSIIDLIYQLTVRKWVIQIGASITASLASGAASAGGASLGSLVGSGSSILSAIGGGMSSGVGSLISGVGSLFGSSTLGAFGTGMGLSSGAAAGAAGAYGAAGMGGVGSALSMGSMLGPAIPLAAAFFALSSIGGAFGKGKKLFGMKGDGILNYIPFAPGLFGALAGLFGKGPKKFGPPELTGDFAADGFHGEFQADWKRKVGLFGGKKRGRRGLGIEDEQVEILNDSLFGIIDSFQTFIKTTGDSKRSLDGWSFAVKQSIATEEELAKMMLSLTDSIAQKLVPELVAVQREGEAIAATVARVSAEFKVVEQLLDITGMTLTAFGMKSIAVKDTLIQLLGGVDNAAQSLDAFYQIFYTDAERTASATRMLNKELTSLGLTAMPTTLAQYRALVEAQDLNTESGQMMFSALVQLAPIFTMVTNAVNQAAIDLEEEAKRIAASFKLLTTDSFASLFEYTKYIRKAANAGVTAAQPENIFPSFATGTNLLPRDMTINAHAGERIVPAADNRELMKRLSDSGENSQALITEVRRLREENRAQSLAIAKNTAKMAKILDRFDGNGMPPERVI